ncbi:MAG: rhodanese-like domain-containing protein [Gammaproteobacteria bacterium]|nr:rhodanese-like domain-containing protein [Gammaproteobacteria bacterium]
MYSTQEIDAEQLKSMQEEGKCFRLLDVRSIAEIQRGCIQGCEPVPLNILQAKLAELDNNETYILYCHSGARSAQATSFMVSQGYQEAYNLRGGILAWAQLGFDIAALS